jgi:hypothetical protein
MKKRKDEVRGLGLDKFEVQIASRARDRVSRRLPGLPRTVLRHLRVISSVFRLPRIRAAREQIYPEQ